jgi:hypothetical protein
VDRPLDATGYDTDKSRIFLKHYQEYFRDFTGPVHLLELGIFHGGSMLLWRDYFPEGKIVGLDINRVEVPDPTGRLHLYQGRQEDLQLLDRIGKETGPFDVIIDDASHLAEPTKISFWHLFQHHLKRKGIYVIEDWRVGYWGGWSDGAQLGTVDSLRLSRISPERQNPTRFKSHDYGLVGFVKQLVDELGADAYTHKSRGSTEPHRVPRFRSLEIFPGQVFIVKSSLEDDALAREPWQRA